MRMTITTNKASVSGALCALLGIVCCLGCKPGKPGKLRGEVQKDVSSLRGQGVLLLNTLKGMSIMRLGEQKQTHLFDDAYQIEDLTKSGSVFVLLDRDRKLYLYEPGKDTKPRNIALTQKVADVAISQDGLRLIATKYRASRSERDDAMFVIDAKTGKSSTLPAFQKGWILAMRWKSDTQVVLKRRDPDKKGKGDHGVLLDLTTKKRTDVKWEHHPDWEWRHHPRTCKGKTARKDDTGIFLEGKSKEDRQYLVHLDGKERGSFHDYRGPFKDVFFTPSCEYLVFSHTDGSLEKPTDPYYAVKVGEPEKLYPLGKLRSAYMILEEGVF